MIDQLKDLENRKSQLTNLSSSNMSTSSSTFINEDVDVLEDEEESRLVAELDALKR